MKLFANVVNTESRKLFSRQAPLIEYLLTTDAVVRRCSVKKNVLRNFAKFTGKHLCQRLFFNKVAGLAWNFIKKDNLAQVLSCEFWETFKNSFFLYDTSGGCFWIISNQVFKVALTAIVLSILLIASKIKAK